MSGYRLSPRDDTLKKIRVVRERYARIAEDIEQYVRWSKSNHEQLPTFVARATIALMELADLIEQTGTLPNAPIMVRLLRAYKALVVLKVEKGV